MELDRLVNEYRDVLGENVAMYAIPAEIIIDGKEYSLEEFLQLCIDNKKLVTDYFPYDKNLEY